MEATRTYAYNRCTYVELIALFMISIPILSFIDLYTLLFVYTNIILTLLREGITSKLEHKARDRFNPLSNLLCPRNYLMLFKVRD